MNVPAQRGPDMGGQDDVRSLLPFVAQSVQRLEDSVARGFADVNIQLSKLPELYVPRREVERRFDETNLDIAEIKSQFAQAQIKHDADIRVLGKAATDDKEKREEAAKEAHKERVASRRWLIGLSATAFLTGSGTVAGIVIHFH